MIRENKGTLILTSLIILCPILLGVYYWNSLPEQMATHFNFNNEVDGYSHKAIAVIGLPVFLLGMHWLCAVMTAHDPRKKNISKKVYQLMLWICPVISMLLAATLYPLNLGITLDIGYIALLFMGGFFAILGNFLPKLRQNYTIGIKLPWTLASEENWNKTHRLAGYLWVVCGLIILFGTMAGLLSKVGAVAIFMIMLLVPSVYSFVFHLKANKK